MDLNFDMAGPALSLGFAAVGSSIGCCIAGIGTTCRYGSYRRGAW